MTHDDASQRITVIGWLFIGFAVYGALQMLAALLHGNINLQLEILGFWIGPGLFRRQERARLGAVVLLGIGIVLELVVTLIILSYSKPAPINFLGIPVGLARPIVMLPWAIVSIALNVWQLRVLIDPEVRAQFVTPIAESTNS